MSVALNFAVKLAIERGDLLEETIVRQHRSLPAYSHACVDCSQAPFHDQEGDDKRSRATETLLAMH